MHLTHFFQPIMFDTCKLPILTTNYAIKGIMVYTILCLLLKPLFFTLYPDKNHKNAFDPRFSIGIKLFLF